MKYEYNYTCRNCGRTINREHMNYCSKCGTRRKGIKPFISSLRYIVKRKYQEMVNEADQYGDLDSIIILKGIFEVCFQILIIVSITIIAINIIH